MAGVVAMLVSVVLAVVVRLDLVVVLLMVVVVIVAAVVAAVVGDVDMLAVLTSWSLVMVIELAIVDEDGYLPFSSLFVII